MSNFPREDSVFEAELDRNLLRVEQNAANMMKTILSERNIHRQNGDIHEFMLIKGEDVNSEAGTIYKLSIDLNLENSLQKRNLDEFYLFGLYGCQKMCCKIASEILESEIDEINDEDDQLLMYINRATKKAVLIFTLKKADWYFERPINRKFNGVTCFKIMCDLCPAIIPCIPNESISGWYYNDDESLAHPFKYSDSGTGAFNVHPIRTNNKLLKEIKISKGKNNIPSNYVLYSDFSPYVYYVEQVTRNYTKERSNILSTYPLSILYLKWGSIRASSAKLYNVLEISEQDCLKKKKKFEHGIALIVSEFNREIKALKETIPKMFTDYITHWSNLKEQVRYYFIFTETIVDRLALIEKDKIVITQLKEKELTKKDLSVAFRDIIYNYLKEFIIDINDKKSYKKMINKFTEMIVTKKLNIRNKFGEDMKNNIEKFINQFEGTFIEISKCTLEKIESISEISKVAIIKNLRKVDIKQIINISPKHDYLLINQSRSKETYVISLYSDNQQYIEDHKKHQKHLDKQVEVVKGSSENFSIIIKHESKCVHECIDKNGHLEIRKDLFLFDQVKITAIRDACITDDRKKLLILNHYGKLLTYDLIMKNSISIYVQDPSISSALKDHSHLLPSDKKGFQKILFQNQYSIILSCSSGLEVYGAEFNKIYSLNAIRVSSHLEKIFIQKDKYFLVQIDTNCFIIKPFTVQLDMIFMEKSTANSAIVEGNPIIDIIFLSIKKFGSRMQVNRNLSDNARKTDTIYLFNYPEQIKKYLLQTIEILKNYEIRDFNLAYMYNNENLVNFQKFKQILFSRVPIHIAAVKNGCLIPLRDGVDTYYNFKNKLQNTNLISNIVNYIRFGHLENIIKELRDIRVISIIGKQSSGKSYLLNKLFGCRFDVSAERCTDGIWMSLAFSGQHRFLVFDCEGLFSSERNITEEMKLGLFLAAISNIFILNSDLTGSRALFDLFNKMVSFEGRIRGSMKLFKGGLDVCIRDCGSHDIAGAEIECGKFIQNLMSGEKGHQMIRIFPRQNGYFCYHNFENEKFDTDVANRLSNYKRLPNCSWSSGREISDEIKILIAKIAEDDDSNFDETAISIFITTKINELENIITNASICKEHFKNEVIRLTYILAETLDLEPLPTVFQVGVFDINYDSNRYYKSFLDNLSETLDTPSKPAQVYMIKTLYHNSFHQSLADFIMQVVNHRNKILTTEVTRLYKEFIEKISQSFTAHSEREKYKNQYKDKFDSIEKLILESEKLKLCEKLCRNCAAVCTLSSNHTGDCDCRTSHQCIFMCSLCENKFKECSNTKSHQGLHKCDQPSHSCLNKCSNRDCKENCSKEPRHIGDCECKKQHGCSEKCDNYKLCKKKCKSQQNMIGHTHFCNTYQCPSKCNLCEEYCASTNHFHGGPHQCSKQHKCLDLCTKSGTCNPILIPKNIIYMTRSGNSFEYNYSEQIDERNPCKKPFPVSAISHPGIHDCKNAHRCESRCPDCAVICKLDFGHKGHHVSDVHRNKDQCIYTSVNKDITKTVGGANYKLDAGEIASPESCLSSCLEKGRGHAHPVRCKGVSHCLGNKSDISAVHSDERYFISQDEAVEVDLLECSAYWKYFGWMAPLCSQQSRMNEFMLCNAYCAEYSHPKEARNYCTGKIFHKDSHNLPCQDEHSKISCFDIIFIVDNTGSMQPYIEKVRNVILQLMTSWSNLNAPTRFGYIGYTDHDYPGNYANIVHFYPQDKNIVSSNLNEIVNFISKIQCSGGSRPGEAMVDALYTATQFTFSKSSKQIYILVADDTPHGDEFYPGTPFPNGCPCGHNWRQLLQKFKRDEAEFIFVKLHNILDKTCRLFNDQYGGNMVIRDDISEVNFEPQVTYQINVIANRFMEFARIALE